MPDRQRKSELALVLCFLAIIFAVPVAQTCVELRRGERVQFTDVFRSRPTARNLREYEATLAEKSVFQQRLRPEVQRVLFAALQDTGAQAVRGRDDWFFYRPDVRYLVEPDHLEGDTGASRWIQPAPPVTHRAGVVRAILRFRDQLQERGIHLLVMPVPGKPSIYPGQLTRRAAGPEQEMESPTLELLRDLGRGGVETVDLFAAFGAARRQAGAAGLYLARDTHWTPTGAALAADAVAQRLRARSWAPAATREFTAHPVAVWRWGDVIAMMQVPGLEREFPAEAVLCQQVLDPALGLLVPPASERPGVFRYPAQQATVLVLGDSFCRIYQFPEPRSLGEPAERPASSPAEAPVETSTKRLLPGSAGFISHLARALRAPVDAIVSDGGASTDVRRKLSTNPEILEGKHVVIWEFVERDVALGSAGWDDVPLPPRLEPTP